MKPRTSVSEARGYAIENHKLLHIGTPVRFSHCVSLLFESPLVEMAQMGRTRSPLARMFPVELAAKVMALYHAPSEAP